MKGKSYYPFSLFFKITEFFPVSLFILLFVLLNSLKKKWLIERPLGSSALRESEASAAMFYLYESEASATNVLSVRKRSGSNKAHDWNGNQPLL
ncbi:hypothetical protein [Lysinibacillus sp. BPa_S21]|uniref:hypothetical protein n=1 Tax=Lysinibacillus sp. BPa_S21 TaxID=2932478 RepID=UPI0020138D14|nr:hypothetical protein [Lysinibacillus sp. BPa_S21]MCL1696878.1 hypothetical protein [Lysinibacillus sp. BPa_S21]